jgi:UDP-N-acetylglucosamine 2-epimerase (non-hydrolysing)
MPRDTQGTVPMICMVVGARPNFMKMAPVILEAKRRALPQYFVHTGQHYDAAMSDVFFNELGMPRPDAYLGVGSASHAEQTARVMTSFERVLLEHHPAVVVVAGDVNSTLACALTASKLQIPVAHLEAGLRSLDRTMPEEINRVLTDHLSDLLLTSEPSGEAHLRREGIEETKIRFVGNCMIDSLRTHEQAALRRAPWATHGFAERAYGLVTLHRPALVDDPVRLGGIRAALTEIAASVPLLFPVHPRTRAAIERSGERWTGVHLVEPLGYLDFLGVMARARVVLTDSGGIQEETTALGVPCVTLRENTERPVTLTAGTNHLAGMDPQEVLRVTRTVLADGKGFEPRVPPLWDGKASVRVVDHLERWAGRP